MISVGLTHYLSLAAILFVVGLCGVMLNRKSLLVVLMSIELMLLAVNINLVAFSHYLGDLGGQIFAFFNLTVAAAELAIGLALVTVFYRSRGSVETDDVSELKG